MRIKFDRKKIKGGWNHEKKYFLKSYKIKQIAIKRMVTKIDR